MPIYEYACSACEHEFEKLQKFSDPPETECPHCLQTGTVAKKLSASAFILAGGGWYKEGYSGKGDGKSVKEKDGTKPAADSKSDTGKSDSGGTSESSSSTTKPSSEASTGHCAA